MKYYIYTLSCPLSNRVRYIGMTKNLKERYANHLCVDSKSSSYKNSWIKSLKSKNLKPIMEELDSSDSLEEIFQLEKYWIAQLKTWGFNLTNLTEGGEGTFGNIKTIETRLKLSKSLKEKYSKESHKLKGIKWDNLRKLQKSNETKLNTKVMAELNKTHQTNKKSIIQLSLNLDYIQEYESIKQASDTLTIASSGISIALNKLDKSAGGFRWQYKKDYPIKKLKDSWNREEVIEQMWLAYKAANTIFEDESALRVEFNNWIDQNL